nr:hypothetical protein [Tanacetum cinerariifolium]
METARSRTEAKLREGRIPEPTKVGVKARQIHHAHKNTKEFLALDKGKFKPPPPMTTPVEKRNASKFCEFHGERIAKQKITQTFSLESVISFPPLGEEDGTEGTMIIEAEMGGHFVHRMYVDGGSSSEILYEHCFNRFCPEVKSQMIPATTPLWTVEAETTFKQMKKLITELPMLTAPKEKEELIIYLAVAKEAASAVLMTERDEKQMPIYFVSRALQGLEINHSDEKIDTCPKVTRRLLKWSFELEEHDIHYRPRMSVKGQILTDFIVKRPKDDPQDTFMGDEETLPDPWILFDATNNEAFNEALIPGLRIAEQMGIKNLQANVDSQLVANQVNGTYIAKEPGMIKYLEKIKSLTNMFKEFSIKQVPRWENKKADALSKIASTSFSHISKQENYVLREIHEGSCSMHAGPRSVVAKALRSGYYWSTMHADAMKLIRECNNCQHPHANSLVEMENRSLGEGIKARLDKRRKNWIEEISHVLWAHRTMIKSSNEETPFSLTYGTEAVILVEIGMPTLRTTKVDMIKNDEALEINLDLLEEKREQAAIHEAKRKAMMEKYYNAGVRNISFKLGDLAYRTMRQAM